MVGNLQQFEFDVPTHTGKQVVCLCAHCVRGRVFQRGVLLQGLVILLHVPPCAVDCGDLVETALHVRAHQILGDFGDTAAVAVGVFVCEELLTQGQREVHPFEVNYPHLTHFQWHPVHAHV